MRGGVWEILPSLLPSSTSLITFINLAQATNTRPLSRAFRGCANRALLVFELVAEFLVWNLAVSG